MKSVCFALIVLACFATLSSVADAERFNVGGNGVWCANPQENYKTWAARNRFQVNDTLYFKYPKGVDSVREVIKADFDRCFVKNSLKNFDNGETEVTLDRSGNFYFVSGNEDHCRKGQKLVVVVLAVRNKPTGPISPAKPPSTAQAPKSPSPVSHVAPANPPSSVSPTHPPQSPPPLSPSHAPANAPVPSSSPAHATPSPSESTPPSHTHTATATAPAPSPQHSASGKAVTSVMATLLTVAFTLFIIA